MDKKVCVHANPGVENQRRYGPALAAAFKFHGYTATVTPDIHQPADIHICMGPHYAKSKWQGHPRTVLMDRCYYRGDPDHVSLGWLRSDGCREFFTGEGRKPPERKPLKEGNKTLFLVDYGGIVEQADTIRFHPAQKRPERPLEDDLATHAIAVGYQTTTLVTAALAGLTVVSKSPLNIMSRPDWLEVLPYADWGFHELTDAVEHLLCHLPQ